MVEPLTNPGKYGGNSSDAFHLVIPSLPGFGFSGHTTERGWNIERVAKAWDELMRRLGYERYGAQGRYREHGFNGTWPDRRRANRWRTL